VVTGAVAPAALAANSPPEEQTLRVAGAFGAGLGLAVTADVMAFSLWERARVHLNRAMRSYNSDPTTCH
jgi:hypothetical protein